MLNFIISYMPLMKYLDCKCTILQVVRVKKWLLPLCSFKSIYAGCNKDYYFGGMSAIILLASIISGLKQILSKYKWE